MPAALLVLLIISITNNPVSRYTTFEMLFALLFSVAFIGVAQSACVFQTFFSAKVNFESLNRTSTAVINGCITPETLTRDAETLEVYTNVEAIKRGAIQNMPNLERISFHNIGVQEISPFCFLNLPKFDFFGGMTNQISSIRYGVFTNTTLSEIYLGYNQISYIEEEAFAYMKNLYVLSFYSNRLKTINKDWFVESNNLKILDLKFNKISVIEEDSFKGLQLATLDLSFNNIHTIIQNAFKDTNFLTLNFMHNNLESFPTNIFGNNSTIKELSLSMNNLTYLPEDLFKTTKISEFYLHPNPITCPCMDDIERLAKENNVKIILPDEDRNLDWDEDELPQCVYWKSARCVYSSLANDTEVLEYFKKLNYDVVATVYATGYKIRYL